MWYAYHILQQRQRQLWTSCHLLHSNYLMPWIPLIWVLNASLLENLPWHIVHIYIFPRCTESSCLFLFRMAVNFFMHKDALFRESRWYQTRMTITWLARKPIPRQESLDSLIAMIILAPSLPKTVNCDKSPAPDVPRKKSVRVIDQLANNIITSSRWHTFIGW